MSKDSEEHEFYDLEAVLKYDHKAMEHVHDDRPKYAGSSITVSMVIVLIMSFVGCQRLTKRTINDLPHLLSIFLGGTIALTKGYVDIFLQIAKYGYEKKLYCSHFLAAIDEGMAICLETGCHKDFAKDGVFHILLLSLYLLR